MKLGTINELGKSRVIVKVDDEFACKLNDLEKAIGNKLSNNLIEFIRSTKNKELLYFISSRVEWIERVDFPFFNFCQYQPVGLLIKKFKTQNTDHYFLSHGFAALGV